MKQTLQELYIGIRKCNSHPREFSKALLLSNRNSCCWNINDIVAYKKKTTLQYLEWVFRLVFFVLC